MAGTSKSPQSPFHIINLGNNECEMNNLEFISLLLIITLMIVYSVYLIIYGWKILKKERVFLSLLDKIVLRFVEKVRGKESKEILLSKYLDDKRQQSFGYIYVVFSTFMLLISFFLIFIGIYFYISNH